MSISNDFMENVETYINTTIKPLGIKDKSDFQLLESVVEYFKEELVYRTEKAYNKGLDDGYDEGYVGEYSDASSYW